jgi:hypothetical protein
VDTTRTQLNQLAPDSGYPTAPAENEDLVVRDDEMMPIGQDAEDLVSQLEENGRIAVEPTHQAAAPLTSNGFQTGSALTHVATTWTRQEDSLRTKCFTISSHLKYTVQSHDAHEQQVMSQLGTQGQSIALNPDILNI